MKPNISIGIQDFAVLREQNCSLVDKTEFIKSWWESNDVVTLITRPWHFGKTLNMIMNCEMDEVTAQDALKNLSYYLHHYWKKRAIILLDEYDTPMQEAYVYGYWDAFTGFIRGRSQIIWTRRSFSHSGDGQHVFQYV